MDFLQGAWSYLLLQAYNAINSSPSEYLPQAAYFYDTYYQPYAPYLAPVYRFVFLSQSYFFRYIYPTLYPFYTLADNALHSLSSDSPDLLTLGILAVVLIVSLKTLDYMRRTIIYWISLGIRLGMWAALIGAGIYVSQRGMEQSVEDFGWVWGLLAGLGEEGEKIGGRKAVRSERAARRIAGSGPRGRTRGAGW
ncbi:hypothetical protein ACLMJK_004065 [Lecanora helva]